VRLLLFAIRRSGWELRISPNGRRIPKNSEEIPLSEDGFFGIEDIATAPEEPPSLTFIPSSDLLLPLRFYEDLEYDFSLLMPFSESDYEQRINFHDNPRYPFLDPEMMHVMSINGVGSSTVGGSSFRVIGRMNFGSRAGAVQFAFDGQVLDFSAEVMSRKLGYEADFSALLDELADKHAELMLHLDGPTTRQLHLNSTRSPSPLVEVLHFRRLMRDEHLPNALATITHNPAFRFSNRDQRELSAFVSEPDMVELVSNPLSLEWSRGGPLARLFRGYTPQTLPTRTTFKNFDIIENRFVKQCLQFLIQRLDHLHSSLPGGGHDATRQAVERWRARLAEVLTHPLWADVGSRAEFPFTVLMQTRPGYKTFAESYLSFDLGISLQTAIGEISQGGGLKQVFELYEIWCYLQLHECLQFITQSEGTPSLSHVIRDQQFVVDIQKGASPVSFIYRIAEQQVELRLFYIRRFRKIGITETGVSFGYSTAFEPDFSIEISAPSGVHWVHLDAKYKLDFPEWDETLGVMSSEDDEFTSKRADLLTMHAYRDGILGTRSSIVLYPGGSEAPQIFVRHSTSAYRQNFNFPSVGTLPLRPGRFKEQQIVAIRALLIDLIQQICAIGSYTEEAAVLPLQ
jgi:predicted component of viral defense system (DUF524 family)